nr:MAG TPA: hypothetical protein [Bacteriophage sp.]
MTYTPILGRHRKKCLPFWVFSLTIPKSFATIHIPTRSLLAFRSVALSFISSFEKDRTYSVLSFFILSWHLRDITYVI